MTVDREQVRRWDDPTLVLRAEAYSQRTDVHPSAYELRSMLLEATDRLQTARQDLQNTRAELEQAKQAERDVLRQRDVAWDALDALEAAGEKWMVRALQAEREAEVYRGQLDAMVRAKQQAERERDEADLNVVEIAGKVRLLVNAVDARDAWMRHAQTSDREVASLRAQLVVVPALVEALTWISDPSYVGNYDDQNVIEIHRKWAKSALSKWEQAQGEKP